MELKPDKTGVFPFPQTLGFFIILVTVLGFVAGWLRNELVLTLLGTIFLTILAYCFLGIFFLGLIYRRKAKTLSMVITSETVSAGKDGEVLLKTKGDTPKRNYFWRLPALLVRCELHLETFDGRVIRHYTDPGAEKFSNFPVKERGAYFGEDDRLVISDAPGFFQLSLPIGGNSPAEGKQTNNKNEKPRLLSLPSPMEETLHFPVSSGGTTQRNEPHFRKSDELLDHRPYVPGDDPRRINWKLFSHAPLGDLLVREGEPEPPPHSRLLILIDSEVDLSLYTFNEGRQAVDLLCESALTAAQDFSLRGIDILIGYTGGKIIGGKEESAAMNATEIASALACPAAIFRSPSSLQQRRFRIKPEKAGLPEENSPASLPDAPEDRSLLILALPRTFAETSVPYALDQFIKKQSTHQNTDLVFLYSTGNRKTSELEESAAACVNLYNKKSKIRVVKIELNAAGEVT